MTGSPSLSTAPTLPQIRPGTTGTAVSLPLIACYQAADPADLERPVRQEFVVPFAQID